MNNTDDHNNLGKEFERRFAFQGYLGNKSFRVGTTPADVWNWFKKRIKEINEKHR